jgi:hypothetical protein
MLHAEPKEQAKAYRRLMREEDDERLLEIVDRSRWPAVLGSEIFYRKIKGEFGHAEPDSDVPQVRDLLPDASHIMKMVCHSYRVTEDILLRSRRGLFNEPRDLAIYLVRRLRGDSLKCIGRDFKISKISSVSSAIRSISVKMEIDKALRDRVEEIRQLIIRKNDKY